MSTLDIVLASGGSKNPTNTYIFQKSTLDIGLASGGSKKPEKTYLSYLFNGIRDPVIGWSSSLKTVIGTCY